VKHNSKVSDPKSRIIVYFSVISALYSRDFYFFPFLCSPVPFLHQVVISMYSLISIMCRKESCKPMMRRLAVFSSTLQCKCYCALDLLEKVIAGSRNRLDIDKAPYIIHFLPTCCFFEATAIYLYLIILLDAALLDELFKFLAIVSIYWCGVEALHLN